MHRESGDENMHSSSVRGTDGCRPSAAEWMKAAGRQLGAVSVGTLPRPSGERTKLPTRDTGLYSFFSDILEQGKLTYGERGQNNG